MATRPKSEAKPADPRGKIVDALMELASAQRFEDISIRDICKTAGVTLADFRDAFPSKGAVLAGFSRRIDRAVLAQDGEELADESPRERLFDILMRRLEAMAPYREGLREVGAWLRRQPAAALAMNQVVVNSMRFVLEAAGIEVEGGAAGAIKRQGRSGLGAHRRSLVGRCRSRPFEDDGGTRPRIDARGACGRKHRLSERAGVASQGDGAGSVRPAPPRPGTPPGAKRHELRRRARRERGCAPHLKVTGSA